MQITLNIDIEGMFQNAIDKYVQNNLVVNNVKNATFIVPADTTAPFTQTDTVDNAETPVVDSENLNRSRPLPKAKADVDYEFAPGCTPRRSPEQIAFHKLELEYGRRLTPAEKGETEAVLEAETEEQEKAKVSAKERIRIGAFVAEAEKTLEQEEAQKEPAKTSIFDEEEPVAPDNVPLVAPAPASNGSGPGIPETDKLDNISHFFT